MIITESRLKTIIEEELDLVLLEKKIKKKKKMIQQVGKILLLIF